MGFPRQKYWSGVPFPSPGDLPNSGIKPGSPALQADALLPEPTVETVRTWQMTQGFTSLHFPSFEVLSLLSGARFGVLQFEML